MRTHSSLVKTRLCLKSLPFLFLLTEIREFQASWYHVVRVAQAAWLFLEKSDDDAEATVCRPGVGGATE